MDAFTCEYLPSQSVFYHVLNTISDGVFEEIIMEK